MLHREKIMIVPVILLIVFIILLRISVWYLPLVRDAFGYAYIGSRVAEGAIIFKDVWDHKPPAISIINAFTYIFSPDYLVGVRIIGILFALFSVFIFYKLLRLFFDKQSSYITSVFFAFFTNVYMVTQGDNLVESYMVPLVSLTYYMFIKAYRQKDNVFLYVLVGILLGVLFLFKQVGILPLAAMVIFLILKKEKYITKSFFMLLGISIIFIPIVYYFIINDAFQNALDAVFFYNFVYSRQGYSISSIGQSLYYFLQVFFATSLFWILGIVGVLRKKFTDSDKLFALFFILAFGGTMLGGKFAFSRNYFLLIFPSLGYFACYAVCELIEKSKKDVYIKKFGIITLIFLMLPSILLQLQAVLSGLYFVRIFNPNQRETMYSLGLPNYNFVTDEKKYYQIAGYLQNKVKKGDFILDFGAEPEFYLLTKTHAPTRFFYNFPINGVFIKDRKQEDKRKIFMEEIIMNKPKYIITNQKEERHKPSYKNLNFKEFKDFISTHYFLEKTINDYYIFKLK